MNSFFHFFINYAIIEAVTGSASQYMLAIAISSVVLDVDHLPYMFSKGRLLLREGLGEKCRTFLHELPGLAMISAVFFALYHVAKDKTLVAVAYSCLALHLLMDFTFGMSRPFYPFSKQVFVSPLAITSTKRKRFLFEIAATLLALVLFLLVL